MESAVITRPSIRLNHLGEAEVVSERWEALIEQPTVNCVLPIARRCVPLMEDTPMMPCNSRVYHGVGKPFWSDGSGPSPSRALPEPIRRRDKQWRAGPLSLPHSARRYIPGYEFMFNKERWLGNEAHLTRTNVAMPAMTYAGSKQRPQ